MKIVVAPNGFRDSLSAELVSKSIIEGIRQVAPRATIIDLPLADGGDGTLMCMLRLFGGKIYSRQVQGPGGRPVDSRFAIAQDGKTAIIEMAEASGARLVPIDERNPFYFSTYGTGELINAAMNLGAKRIFLGVGGSCTMDGGAGALAALGVTFRDSHGVALQPTPSGLRTLHQIDTSGLDPRLQRIRTTVLCDVHTTVKECVRRYGRQKGVKPSDERNIDKVLSKLANLAQARGSNILEKSWLGAGGGLAGGLVAFAKASAVGGAEYLCYLAGVKSHLRDADLLLTGEGKFDKGSFQGKLPLIVSQMAAQHKVAATIIAGQIANLDHESIPDLVSLVSLAKPSMNLKEMLQDVAPRIQSASKMIVKQAMNDSDMSSM
jgi:glycerate 2-kinase